MTNSVYRLCNYKCYFNFYFDQFLEKNSLNRWYPLKLHDFNLHILKLNVTSTKMTF